MMLKIPDDFIFCYAVDRYTYEEALALEWDDSIRLTLIDFGLSRVSNKIEDKAVDIYVLKRALISTHPGSEPFFDKILQGYKERMTKF